MRTGTVTAQAPSAIVIGLDGLTGLQTCRILSRRGVRVVGLVADDRDPACRTNTVSGVVPAPASGEGLLAVLEQLGVTEPGAVVVPCTDPAVRTLVAAPTRIRDLRTALPSADVVAALTGAGGLAELGLAHGLPVGDQDDGERQQRYLCSVYVSPRGMPILTFVARQVRRWPPDGGPTTLAVAVDEPRIRDLAMGAISCLPFAGLATLEIARDVRTGSDRLVRVTVGRPTVSSAIAEAGGVEVLATMYRDLTGQPLPLDRRQHERPVAWIDVAADLRAANHERRTAGLTARAWVRSVRGRKVTAHLDLSDLGPTFDRLGRRLRSGSTARRSVEEATT